MAGALQRTVPVNDDGVVWGFDATASDDENDENDELVEVRFYLDGLQRRDVQ